MLMSHLHHAGNVVSIGAASGDESKGAAYRFGVLTFDVLLLVGVVFGVRGIYRAYMRCKYGIDRRRGF